MPVTALKNRGILKARKTFALTALEDDDGFRVIDFDDRHAGDGAAGIIARIGIHDIVSADDDGDVRCW
jgi:hypothetical protein